MRIVWMAAALAIGPTAHAAHPLTTDDTGTQGRGGSQLELLAEVTRERSAGSTVRGRQFDAAFSYGASDTVDLQIGLPYQRSSTDAGAGTTVVSGAADASLGFKWRFYDREALSIALKPVLTLGNGDETRGLGTGRSSWGVLTVLTYAPGPLTLHSHLSYQRNRNSVDQRGSLWQVAGAAAWAWRKNIHLVAEATSETNSDRSASRRIDYLQVGAIWSPRKTLDLDLGWRVGANDAATDRTLRAGLTIRW